MDLDFVGASFSVLGTKESQLRNPGSLPLVHCAFWFCGGLTPNFSYSFCGGLSHRILQLLRWALLHRRLVLLEPVYWHWFFICKYLFIELTARFLQVNLSLEINFVYNPWNICAVDVLSFACSISVHCHFHTDIGLQQVLHWHFWPSAWSRPSRLRRPKGEPTDVHEPEPD